MDGSFHLSYTVTRKFVCLQKYVYFSLKLCFKRWMVSRSCYQQNSSTFEVVDDICDGRRVVAGCTYYTSMDRNALTPLFRLVVVLL